MMLMYEDIGVVQKKIPKNYDYNGNLTIIKEETQVHNLLLTYKILIR
jgi:hypothetical protein